MSWVLPHAQGLRNTFGEIEVHIHNCQDFTFDTNHILKLDSHNMPSDHVQILFAPVNSFEDADRPGGERTVQFVNYRKFQGVILSGEDPKH